MRNQLGLWWGLDIHSTHFNIVCLICWFLLFLMIYVNLFRIYCWDILASHRDVDACKSGTPFLPYNPKILWMYMFSWDTTMFDAMIDCLDACLIVFDENTYYVSNLQTNLSCFMIALWEAVQVRALTLLYCNLIVFDMPHFKIT